MKTTLSLSLAAACIFLFTGCKKAEPKFQVAVPAGWQVAVDKEQEGDLIKVLANADLKIIVACSSAEKYPMEALVAENMAAIAQIGGEITEFNVADDKSSVRLAFTAESEEAGKFIGKLVLKKDSAGKGKILTVVSLWPAAQDAVAGPAFEQVAASADFK